MGEADALHSRMVAGLRVVLPLAALGLLSTLFLLSRDIDPSRALVYSEVDAEDLARDPRITAPRLSTVTPDGLAVTLSAETVRIAAGGRETTEAQGVTTLITATDGVQSRLSADTATVDPSAGWMVLSGGVRMTDGRGHALTSQHLHITFETSTVESPGPVAGEGPLGRMTAGAMRLTLDPATLHLSDGVRVVHQPAPAGAGEDDRP